MHCNHMHDGYFHYNSVLDMIMYHGNMGWPLQMNMAMIFMYELIYLRCCVILI